MARKRNPKAPPDKPLDESLGRRLPAHLLQPFADTAKTYPDVVETEKINNIGHLLWLPPDLGEAVRDARILKALDLFESIKPTDGTETMLAEQMIGAHSAASECMRRAMLPEQSAVSRNANLELARKLMDLYLRQMSALDKHRGKGQQKITVERIQVASGAQAIVGDVHAAPSQGAAAPEPSAALVAPEAQLPEASSCTRQRVPR